MIRFVVWVCALVALVVGCGEPAPAAPDATVGDWRCPATWVRHARGGCGPAVLLCVPDGGAGLGACEGVDLSRPPTVDDGDGGVATGFWRAPDGAIRGAWKEPGEPGGPPARDWHPPALDGLERRIPAADWAPDAGIPSCPAGWARTSDGVCDPRLPTDCPEGSGALPGGGCTRTAERDCPAGEWPDVGAEAVGAQVLRVREGADDARADGSAARPYGTITAALTASTDNAWVLVAAGRYPERLRFTRSVHLVGVCAARAAVVEPAPADSMRALVATAPDASVALDLRGLSLRGGAVALYVSSGSSARVRSLRIAGAPGGILAEQAGTSVTAEDVFYDGALAHEPYTVPVGLLAGFGTRVRASRVHVLRAPRFGVATGRDGTLVLSDSLIRDTRARSNAAGGAVGGAGAMAGFGTTTIERSVVTGSRVAGLASAGTGSLLTAVDVIVSETRYFDGLASGVYAVSGGRIVARRLLASRNDLAGVQAQQSGVLSIESSAVRDTLDLPGVPIAAWGLVAAYGGRVDARGVICERNRGAAAVSSGESSELTISDSVLADTPRGAERPYGDGLVSFARGMATGRRLLLRNNAGPGVIADAAARLRLEDSRIEDTREAGIIGDGALLYVAEAADADVRRVRVWSDLNHAVLVADPGSRLSLLDVDLAFAPALRGAVERTGLAATLGASLTAARVRIHPGAEVGVASLGAGSQLDLSEAWVEGSTRPGATGGAVGVLASRGGALSASRVRIEGLRENGVAALDRGSASIFDGVVTGLRSQTDGTGGLGAYAGQGGSVALTRTLIDDVQRGGAVADTGASLRLDDVAIVGTLPRAEGVAGHGVFVAGARAALRGVVLRGNHDFGLLGVDGASVDARDLAVFDTLAVFDGTGSAGVTLRSGSTATLTRALLAGNAHSAVVAIDPRTRLTLADIVVTDTRPTRLGFGVGVAAFDGASVTLSRGAVERSGGFGIGAVRRVHGGADLAASDLFVRAVADRAVRDAFPQGPPVAYGVTIGAGCEASLDRATVIGSGWGFFQTAGALRWREGVIVGPRDGPGAVSGTAAQTPSQLDAVRFVDSPTADIARDLALPEALLPVPPAPCALPPCGAR